MYKKTIPLVFSSRRLMTAMFLPGIFLFALALAAYLAPNLLAYFLVFFSVLFGTFFVAVAYKVSRFVKKLSDLQRGGTAPIMFHSNFHGMFSGESPAPVAESSSAKDALAHFRKKIHQAMAGEFVDEALVSLKGRSESLTSDSDVEVLDRTDNWSEDTWVSEDWSTSDTGEVIRPGKRGKNAKKIILH